MPKVFISYRRSDTTAGYASWIYERLTDSFGAGSVFMDIDSLPLGVDFAEQLAQHTASADAALILIGPGWLDAIDERGARRLDDPEDFVRREVAAVLQASVRVIPVLIDGVKMPDATALPEELRPLARRQALVFDRHGGTAFRDLTNALQEIDAPPSSQPRVISGREVRRGSRKVVTALFCDVTGSTALGEELDPEALHGVMSRYFKELQEIVERHGGTVANPAADSIMAVFGIPQVREDDALRAVRAAWEIRERTPAVAQEVGVVLSLRTAVNTGLVLSGEGENLATGDAVNLAARLEQAAAPGEILLGPETLRLVPDAVRVEELEPLVLKGKSEAVRAFRLLGVDRQAPGRVRPLDRPLVGRERELELLRGAWERAVEQSGCHLVTVLGVAGVGKSRLVAELLATVGDAATVLRGRCLHYGEGITFWPLLKALDSLGEVAQRVRDRLLVGGTATPEELFWEVRRLLESVALGRPVILHVDDLQWAEDMLLDLLDHIVELSRGAPILLLCTARPELLDDRPTWGGGKLNAATLLLEPLGATESELLLDQLGEGIDRDLRDRVIAASEGNPLFLEEMASLAREQRAVAVPATIQALLAARLDLLAPEQQDLLEYGAVEGEVFHRDAVKMLVGDRADSELDLRLGQLVRRELIRPHVPMLEGGDAFRFRHLLLRDAAYDRLPKARRAELHERFGDWLEENARDLPELDEIAGWHLEQAIRYLRELGREPDADLVRGAADHLHTAGRRAAIRRDTAAARSLLERALALTQPDAPLHARIALALADSLVEAGEYEGVEQLLAAAEVDPEAAPTATVVRLHWMAYADTERFLEIVDGLLGAAIEELERRGDNRGLAKAHIVARHSHWLACQPTPAAEELRLAAEYARAAGDEGTRVQALGWYVMALVRGRTPVAEVGRELDAIESEQPGPYLAARLDHSRGFLAALDGNFEEARLLLRRAFDQLEALGQRHVLGAAMLTSGEIELVADNPTGARDVLLEGDSLLEKLGEVGLRSTIQAELAWAYEQLGEREEAWAAIERAEALSPEEDLVNFVLTNVARARLALTDGDLTQAEYSARSAIAYAAQTDFPLDHGEARLELARVLSAAGRRDEALIEAGEALALFEAKGARPQVAEARAALEEL